MKIPVVTLLSGALLATLVGACRTPDVSREITLAIESGGTARIASATARPDGTTILVTGILRRRLGTPPTGREVVEIRALDEGRGSGPPVRTRPLPRLVPITRQGVSGRSRFAARIPFDPAIRSLQIRIVDSSALRIQTPPAL